MSLYGRYAEGFKSGGFNGEAGTAQEATTPFKPEKLKSYELGAKSTLLDGRMTLNVAVFNNDSTDLQQALFTAKGAAASEIRNIGRASSRGVEIEAVARRTTPSPAATTSTPTNSTRSTRRCKQRRTRVWPASGCESGRDRTGQPRQWRTGAVGA